MQEAVEVRKITYVNLFQTVIPAHSTVQVDKFSASTYTIYALYNPKL